MSSRLRRGLGAAWLAGLLAVTATAQSRDDPARRAGDPRAPGRHAAERQLDRAEQAERRSRQELRALDRDARRRAGDALGPPDTSAGVRAQRERARAGEEFDALRARSEDAVRDARARPRHLSAHELGALERRAGHALGPVTRRVLERSEIEVRLADRLADADERAREEEGRLRREKLGEPPF